jgi:hypothetical protein
MPSSSPLRILVAFSCCWHLRCLDEVITVAAMLSAEHVFSSASGLTGPQQQGRGPTDAARKLQELAAQVGHAIHFITWLPRASQTCMHASLASPIGQKWGAARTFFWL